MTRWPSARISDRAGWSSSGDSTSSISSATSTLRRWSWSASSTRSRPVAAAEEIVGALPEGIAQFEAIDGAGHFRWMDAPERYWPVLIEFIGSTIGRERVEP
jgi:pimeloyl-ACP methyl ester carboxylesterase